MKKTLTLFVSLFFTFTVVPSCLEKNNLNTQQRAPFRNQSISASIPEQQLPFNPESLCHNTSTIFQQSSSQQIPVQQKIIVPIEQQKKQSTDQFIRYPSLDCLSSSPQCPPPYHVPTEQPVFQFPPPPHYITESSETDYNAPSAPPRELFFENTNEITDEEIPTWCEQLENVFSNTIDSPTIPSPESLKSGKKIHFLQCIHDGSKKIFGRALVSQKKVDSSLAHDQAKQHAKITQKMTEASISVIIEEKRAARKIQELIKQQQEALEKTRKQQETATAYAALFISQSVPSNDAIKSPELVRRRSKSISSKYSNT